MYKIVNIKKDAFEYIEMYNPNNFSKAIISLNEGGRLQSLMFGDIKIIGDPPNSKYKNTFASSILFPFANRVKNGKYSFEGQNYQLVPNENGRKNAIHGLVFNKKFILIDKEEGQDFASVTLSYEEVEISKGFPFYYKILLVYTLKENAITLTVKIKNVDQTPFPYVLGWHPYFISKDLENSTLIFESDKKIQFDENLITSGITDCKLKMPYQVENNQMDDCFILKTNTVDFETPKYQVKINTNTEENYFQFYTPNNRQAIAIEPMTGVSDSFNNKIGLQVLQPNEEYELTWRTVCTKKNQNLRF